MDGFAKAIAKSIANARAEDGLVYAINGPWGSGKSSAINLICRHLEASVKPDELEIVSFNPWWFTSTEALTLAFFQEMRATIGKSLSDQAQEAMATMGSKLSSAGPLLGGLAAIFATPAAGAAVAGGATLIEKLTRSDVSVTKQHKILVEALREQRKRFVVLLDDIDRLSRDEALQVFKLVKSVGRLPNIVYVLAFDAKLAAEMISESFAGEGFSYLEKIIQASFDLPQPDSDDLKQKLLASISEIIGDVPDQKVTAFGNLFFDAVMPLIKTPRDVVRLVNAFGLTFPAVKGEVDAADFLALEAMRIFTPTVHQAVRSNSSMLTGRQSEGRQSRDELKERYNQTFLGGLDKDEREIAQRSLRRLFPRLDAVWANTWRTDDEGWDRNRNVCGSKHFDTYFSLSVKNSAITALESNDLIENAGVPGATKESLLRYLGQTKRNGGSRASLALEELRSRASEIPEEAVETFLKDVFEVADTIDIESDHGRGMFDVADNSLRIHWLLNRVVFDRFALEKRSEIMRATLPSASLSWFVSLSDRLYRSDDDENSPRREIMVDDDTAKWAYDLSLDLLRTAAQDSTLIERHDLMSLLFRWRDRAGLDEVRQWTDEKLASTEFVVAAARAAVRTSWSQGMGGFGFLGDTVSTRHVFVELEPYRELVDIDRLRSRVDELLASDQITDEQHATLRKLKDTPERETRSVVND
ncbi:KAP family P-loop NTPase fold protein [Agrobacterium sp. 22-222-1]